MSNPESWSAKIAKGYSSCKKTHGARLLDTLESGRVTRYHSAPSVAPQTNGLHQWGVFVLVMYITHGQASRELLIECAAHDTAEFFTGDVPFTVKRDNKDIKERFDAMEDTARENELLFPCIELSERETAILKMADTLEGLIWCSKTERHGIVKDRWVGAYQRAVEKFKRTLTPDEIHACNRIAQLFV